MVATSEGCAAEVEVSRNVPCGTAPARPQGLQWTAASEWPSGETAE